MRVCDITRSEEVVGTIVLTIDNGSENEDKVVQTIEVGPAALAAFQANAWGALQNLVPPALRVKDVKKQAAAKKAATSRAANAKQKATTTSEEAGAGPSDKGQANTAADAAEPPAAPEKPEHHSGDPGF